MTRALGQDAWRAICAANPGIPYDKEIKMAETYEFDLALDYLKSGRKVRRVDSGLVLTMQGDAIVDAKTLDLWTPTQADLTGDDWVDA